MMIEKIITKNNQDFQYFSESRTNRIAQRVSFAPIKKAKSFFIQVIREII